MSQLKIQVEKPAADKLKTLGVLNWGIWTKEPSTFDWHYDEREVCYFLEGEVKVKTPYETGINGGVYEKS